MREEVETLYEKNVAPFGNSTNVDGPRKFKGRRVYVIVLKS